MRQFYHRTERERWGHNQRTSMPQFWVGAYLLTIALAIVLIPLVVSAVKPLFNEVGAAGDTSLVALTRTINEIGAAHEEFMRVNTKRMDGLTAKLDALEAGGGDLGAIRELRDRIEEMESHASGISRTGPTKYDPDHRRLFDTWIRSCRTPENAATPMQELANYERHHKLDRVIRGDVTIGTGAAGGFAVPKEIADNIERLEKRFSPVRDLVTVREVGTSDYHALVNIRQSPLSGALSGWVAETGTRSATVTPNLRDIVPTHGELYAYPQCSEWSLDDVFFDVGAWLADEVAQEFALQEGSAVLTGNGTNKPTGMLNTTPTTVADFASPIRAAAVYQYVASSASPDAIVPDALITLLYTLASQYRANATWIMNSNSAAAIRKLKDTTNQYLWQPGLAAGEPDRLLGYPVRYWEQMADVGANTFPVAFGDWRRAYLLTTRAGGMRITRDNVTNVGFVRFYIRRREGGMVYNNDAGKWLRTT